MRVIATSYHDSVKVLQGKKLVAPGPFDRTEWFQLLESATDMLPFVAVARSGSDYLALPLARNEEGLDPLCNWYSFVWRPLLSPGADGFVLSQALARDLKQHASQIVLWPVPDEDGSANMLQQGFIAAGWFVHRAPCDSNHFLPVKGRSFAEYLSSRPGSIRTSLKRKADKVEVRLLTSFQYEDWNSYEDIYRKSWKPAEGNPGMLREFAWQEGAAGRLRLALALHNGLPVAAQVWTVENGTAYIHKLAHMDDARPLSAGTILTAALLEHVLDVDRVEFVDFGTGNDGYKADWMEDVRPRFRLECLKPTHPGNWPRMAGLTLRRLASHLRAG